MKAEITTLIDLISGHYSCGKYFRLKFTEVRVLVGKCMSFGNKKDDTMKLEEKES